MQANTVITTPAVEGLLLVDKPKGPTSMEVDRKIKRLTGARRVGHLGTLDPMATGILPLFLGRATRLIPYFEDGEKEYVVDVALGVETDTWDLDGKIMRSEKREVKREEVEQLLPAFVGEIAQVPPPISAKQFKGERFYDIARDGREVPKISVPVKIFSVELLAFSEQEGAFRLRVRCSKGTYTRSIAHEIGIQLGCGAAQSGLRRTLSTPFDVSHAHPLEDIEKAALTGQFDSVLTPMPAILSIPKVSVEERWVERLRSGQNVPVNSGGAVRSYDLVQVISEPADLVAIGWLLPNGTVKPERVLA